MSVKKGVILNLSTVENETSLLHSKLGDGLNIACSSIKKLDMRGAIVSTIYDGNGVWPDEIALDGFQYEYINAVEEDSHLGPMTKRPASWFVNWLGRQKEFSPQPYEQCAKVLRAAGAPDKANAVLYACKEREREQATGWRKFWLGCMKVIIGYGLGVKYFRALWWVLGLVALGWLVALGLGETNKSWYWLLAFSLDRLLPIFSLGQEFDSQILTGWPWAYFVFLHKPLGFILASFVVAGLAGVGRRETD